MEAIDYIEKVRAAGFDLAADGDRLLVFPVDRLSDQQRQFLRTHKTEILAALHSPGTILEADQAGNDLEPANDRVVVHVPDLMLDTGQRISCDLDLPRKHLEGLRAVVRFQLKENGGGGSVLGEPGMPREALVVGLRARYGGRLATIDGEDQ